MTDVAEEPTSPTSESEAGDAAPVVAPAPPSGPQFILMSVSDVSFDLPSPNPVLRMVEPEAPYRHLEVPVALPEAQALAQALFQVSGPRPSTHELFTSVLRASRNEIVALRIVRFEKGVYFAEMDLISSQGRVVLDCRVTDGVALALRQTVPAPILCAVSVLEAVS